MSEFFLAKNIENGLLVEKCGKFEKEGKNCVFPSCTNSNDEMVSIFRFIDLKRFRKYLFVNGTFFLLLQ